MSRTDYCNIPVLYRFRDVEHHTQMGQWLVKNIDPACYDAEDWNFSSSTIEPHTRKIWFAHDKDAVWFRLKWS